VRGKQPGNGDRDRHPHRQHLKAARQGNEGQDEMYQQTLLTPRDEIDTLSEPAQLYGRAPQCVEHLRGLAGAIEASGYCVFFAGLASARSRLVPFLDSDFPAISSASRELTEQAADRLSCVLAGETRPVIWFAEGEEPDPAMLAELRWAVTTALPSTSSRSGIAFPVDDGGRRRGVVAFFGKELKLCPATIARHHWALYAIFRQISVDRPLDAERAPPISKREIECLKLTANGMTSEDIASELGLSVHTANQYLANSTQKLDAVNRVHAVAKALRIGLID
jgi:DNA-binding CsgD family transcriptional regulator